MCPNSKEISSRACINSSSTSLDFNDFFIVEVLLTKCKSLARMVCIKDIIGSVIILLRGERIGLYEREKG